ncbi:hypothetical protein J7K07_06600 [Candidatus Bathyarchaeota archaeon]|nr:hypothetical protein [Candidatus Bathyarchaeota archaeon]
MRIISARFIDILLSMSFPHVIAANLLESVNSSISSAVIFSSLEGFQGNLA